jgi:hypothetical protein
MNAGYIAKTADAPVFGGHDGAACNDMTLGCSSLSDSIQCSLNSMTTEAGATVGGAASSQVFGKTNWAGDDGVETVFTFHLVGTDNVDRAKKMDEFLKLKSELGL